MKISQNAISNPLAVIILTLAAVLFGIYAYFVIPVEAEPEVTIPWVSVYVPYLGAAPEEVENLIVRDIEEELRGIENLKHIFSTASSSGAQVWVEFEIGGDLKESYRDVQEAINRIKYKFPDDAQDPIIRELKMSNRPIIRAVLLSDGSREISYEKLADWAEDLKKPIEGVTGISHVDIFGGKEREFKIVLDPALLKAKKIGVGDVINAVRNSNISFPAGSVTLDRRDYLINFKSKFQNVQDVRRSFITNRNGTPIYIEDVASVLDTLEETSSYSRVDSKPGVTLSVYRRTGVNIVKSVNGVKAVVENYQEKLPKGVELEITSDMSDYVKDNINNLKNSAVFGGILVTLILIIGIGWRNAPLVALAIPFIIIITIGLVFLFGYSLNNMTFFGLILLLGIVVDGAIVIVESSFRHLEYGYNKLEAARKGINEVGTAVMASALTTMGAFTPMLFVSGIMGEFLSLIPITIIMALSVSIIIDHIVIPVFAAKMLKLPKRHKENQEKAVKSPYMNFYRKTLDWALGHRLAVVLITIAVMFVSLFSLGAFVKTEFFPQIEIKEFTVNLEMPGGTSLKEIDRITKEVEKLVQELPNIERYNSTVGISRRQSSGVTPSESNIYVSVEENSKTKPSVLAEMLRKKIKENEKKFIGVKTFIALRRAGPPQGSPVQITVRGDDINKLISIAEKLKKEISIKIKGVRNINYDFSSGTPEIKIFVNREKAAYYGISPQLIVQTISTAFNGYDVSEINLNEKDIDIRVELKESLQNLEELRLFPIISYQGNDVPLEEVADIKIDAGVSTIRRKDSGRELTITADVFMRTNDAVNTEILPLLEKYNEPGYIVKMGEDRSSEQDTYADMGKAIIVAVILIYVIMSIQFNSLVHPFVIMFTVPFSIIGVIFGHIITGTNFGLMSFIGILALVGIVVNDAIVLITYTNKLRKDGYSIFQALRKAGPIRFRPILMTSVTTIGGMLPLALGIGIKYNYWSPLSISVIFGLIFSTLLTLIVIPVVYALFNRSGVMPKDLPEVNIMEED